MLSQSVPRKNTLVSSGLVINKIQNLLPITSLNSLEKLRQKGQFDSLEVSSKSSSKLMFSKKFNEDPPRMKLPTISSIRKSDDMQETTQYKNAQLQMIYNNNTRLPPRLPKLEIQNEIERQNERKKYSSYDPKSQISVVEDNFEVQKTPERLRFDKKSNKSLPQLKGLVYQMKTKAGCQGNKQTKTNQDATITNHKSLEQLGYQFFAVCDGHGVNGHIVSGMIKNTLPKQIARYLKDEPHEQSLSKGFMETNKEICYANLDTNLSGSTTVSLLIKKDQIWSANVGDSRAIMCRQIDNIWKVIELSQDHKPEEPKERQRVLDFGGRIEAQKDFYGNPIGPERVWLSYIDAPGLAMTRSLGDKVGAQAGVISEPEILEFNITEDDRFIVVASDGVWEYLSNEDVMNIIIPSLDNIEQACEKVIVESTAAWRKQSFARDDITCIIILLEKQ